MRRSGARPRFFYSKVLVHSGWYKNAMVWCMVWARVKVGWLENGANAVFDEEIVGFECTRVREDSGGRGDGR